jgi:hypothetical protein
MENRRKEGEHAFASLLSHCRRVSSLLSTFLDTFPIALPFFIHTRITSQSLSAAGFGMRVAFGSSDGAKAAK